MSAKLSRREFLVLTQAAGAGLILGWTPGASAAAEARIPCDRVNVVMLYSKVGRSKKSAEPEIQRVALSRDPKETTERQFETFPAFLQDNCNVRTLRHLSVGERVLRATWGHEQTWRD